MRKVSKACMAVTLHSVTCLSARCFHCTCFSPSVFNNIRGAATHTLQAGWDVRVTVVSWMYNHGYQWLFPSRFRNVIFVTLLVTTVIMRMHYVIRCTDGNGVYVFLIFVIMIVNGITSRISRFDYIRGYTSLATMGSYIFINCEPVEIQGYVLECQSQCGIMISRALPFTIFFSSELELYSYLFVLCSVTNELYISDDLKYSEPSLLVSWYHHIRPINTAVYIANMQLLGWTCTVTLTVFWSLTHAWH